MAPWPSGKAEACKAFIPSSNLGGASKTKSTARAVLFCFGTMCSAGAERDVHFVRDVACGSDVRCAREAEHITSLCADGAIHHCAIARHHIGKADTSHNPLPLRRFYAMLVLQ